MLTLLYYSHPSNRYILNPNADAIPLLILMQCSAYPRFLIECENLLLTGFLSGVPVLDGHVFVVLTRIHAIPHLAPSYG
jgi:hypothetical protein